MLSFKCDCGGMYRILPDEEANDLPPSFTAKLMHCETCNITEWKDSYDLDLEEWPDEIRTSI